MKIKINKKIIISLLVLLIVLVMIIVICNLIKKENNKKIELGNSIYEEIHNLYLYGNGIEYVYDDDKNRIYIEDDGKYYEIKDKKVFTDLISSESLDRLTKIFEIKEKDNKYYISDFGRGITNAYYGTKLEIKKISKNKIEYKAISTLCKIDSIVSYGEGCTSDGYYEVEKPFILVKENGIWKVSEYTSVFQFSDREIK